MTKVERLLAVVGMAVVASAVLLIAYVQHSNPADASAAGCSEERWKLGQALDQVRFSTSATRAVAAGLDYSSRTLDAYQHAIETTRLQLSRSHISPRQLIAAQDQLGRATWVLADQNAPLTQAKAMTAEVEREVTTAVPLISEASRDVQEQDCSALSLTMWKSGWPKDQLLNQLARAARLNSEVDEKLDASLDLIMRAQRIVRPYLVASK